jgi:electron transfer flavoprotein alpha subunit
MFRRDPRPHIPSFRDRRDRLDDHQSPERYNTRSAADAAARVAGVAQVLLADAPQLAEQLGENVAAQVLAMAADYGHILFPAKGG